MGAFGGQRPGGQDRRRHAFDQPPGHVLAPLAELDPVLPAAQPVHVHHGGRLGQAERQAIEVLAEVKRLHPLVGIVGEPRAQVGQGLPAAEPADRDDLQARRAGVSAGQERRTRQPGGDDDLTGRASLPQPPQVGQVGQVIDDQCPRAVRPGQPGHQGGRGGLGAGLRVGGPHQLGRLGEPGEHRFPAQGADPDQDLDHPAGAQRVHELGGELRLARASLGRGRRLGFRTVGQHRGLAGEQAGAQVGAGLGTLEVRVGERRDDASHHQPRGRRRSGPLRDHADCLSAGT